ncbi:hypothetical protein DC3_24060 [Deinococcus cellulosilyticus NBRC 106333 = KACC 11606]|uniref:Uncharacterized protein n=1 Tax=Deinococcus cellulosilyticus (strain DSM 18568 / NBRC 106333 / KACC 11606 / 5516J-15) TaxID=1223518 RepID=A0A511N2X9_DEIC1|nr:hypothetical protein DC3_24060 [Deinococcus cellulosilyticus NBRC 106333 = KACC 11606]
MWQGPLDLQACPSVGLQEGSQAVQQEVVWAAQVWFAPEQHRSAEKLSMSDPQ